MPNVLDLSALGLGRVETVDGDLRIGDDGHAAGPHRLAAGPRRHRRPAPRGRARPLRLAHAPRHGHGGRRGRARRPRFGGGGGAPRPQRDLRGGAARRGRWRALPSGSSGIRRRTWAGRPAAVADDPGRAGRGGPRAGGRASVRTRAHGRRGHHLVRGREVRARPHRPHRPQRAAGAHPGGGGARRGQHRRRRRPAAVPRPDRGARAVPRRRPRARELSPRRRPRPGPPRARARHRPGARRAQGGAARGRVRSLPLRLPTELPYFTSGMVEMWLNGERRKARVEARTTLLDMLRGGRPARRQARLRDGRVRRLHGPAGRPSRVLLPHARPARGRPARRDGRGAGNAGRPASRAAGLRGHGGDPVRLLHAGHGAVREGPARRGAPAHRDGRPRRPGRLPLPLYGLRQAGGGGDAGGGAPPAPRRTARGRDHAGPQDDRPLRAPRGQRQAGHRARDLRGRHRGAGDAVRAHPPLAARPRPHRPHRRQPGPGHAGRRLRPDPRGRAARALHHRRPGLAGAVALRRGDARPQGALRRRSRGGGGRRRPRAGAARLRGHQGRVRGPARGPRPGAGHGRRGRPSSTTRPTPPGIKDPTRNLAAEIVAEVGSVERGLRGGGAGLRGDLPRPLRPAVVDRAPRHDHLARRGPSPDGPHLDPGPLPRPPHHRSPARASPSGASASSSRASAAASAASRRSSSRTSAGC